MLRYFVFSVLIACVIYTRYIHIIKVGHLGILIKDGVVQDDVLPPGVHFIASYRSVELKSFHINPLRGIIYGEMLSKDGVMINITIQLLCHIDPMVALKVWKLIEGMMSIDEYVHPQVQYVFSNFIHSNDASYLTSLENQRKIGHELGNELFDKLIKLGVTLDAIIEMDISFIKK